LGVFVDFRERRIMNSQMERRIVVALMQHQLKVGLFRSFCRCGYRLHAPYRYSHRLHLAAEIADLDLTPEEPPCFCWCGREVENVDNGNDSGWWCDEHGRQDVVTSGSDQ
jgi:hypothetical protein